jgi:hypothetical protein
MHEDSPAERWLPIPDWEDSYEASSLGRIRSRDRDILMRNGAWRRHHSQILRPSLAGSGSGHLKVSLARGGRSTTRYVHQLVLETFVGPRPPGFEGCHNNGNHLDNNLVNLRWDTASANRFDAVRHGTHTKTARTACPREHLLVAPNLRDDPSGRGYRRCLACLRAYKAKRTAVRRRTPFDFAGFADEQYRLIMDGETA